MNTTRVMVALALWLGACGTTGSTTDAGGDAQVADIGGVDVATEDAGGDAGEDAGPDAGWCTSEQCVQRVNYIGECMEIVRNGSDCDDEDPLTYDDRCNAQGGCFGIPCECTESAGCCDGCRIIEADEPCNEPPDEGPTMCFLDVSWEIRERLCDGGTTECGDRYTVAGTGEAQCPPGTSCVIGAPMGMRCQP